jgi:acyl-coenzyme A synthetase/AMP-(fatty) acid ligase
MDMRDLLEEDHPDAELPIVKPSDVCGLYQTSGSTGVQKFVTYIQQFA